MEPVAHIASYRPFCTRMAVCQAGLPVGPRAGFRRMSPCILYEVGEPLVKSVKTHILKQVYTSCFGLLKSACIYVFISKPSEENCEFNPFSSNLNQIQGLMYGDSGKPIFPLIPLNKSINTTKQCGYLLNRLFSSIRAHINIRTYR